MTCLHSVCPGLQLRDSQGLEAHSLQCSIVDPGYLLTPIWNTFTWPLHGTHNMKDEFQRQASKEGEPDRSYILFIIQPQKPHSITFTLFFLNQVTCM